MIPFTTACFARLQWLWIVQPTNRFLGVASTSFAPPAVCHGTDHPVHRCFSIIGLPVFKDAQIDADLGLPNLGTSGFILPLHHFLSRAGSGDDFATGVLPGARLVARLNLAWADHPVLLGWNATATSVAEVGAGPKGPWRAGFFSGMARGRAGAAAALRSSWSRKLLFFVIVKEIVVIVLIVLIISLRTRR